MPSRRVVNGEWPGFFGSPAATNTMHVAALPLSRMVGQFGAIIDNEFFSWCARD